MAVLRRTRLTGRCSDRRQVGPNESVSRRGGKQRESRATLLTCENRPQSSGVGNLRPCRDLLCVSPLLDTPAPAASATPAPSADPAAPDLGFLTQDPGCGVALLFRHRRSDHRRRIRWRSAACRSSPARRAASPLTEAESAELQQLKLQALRQGRAVGAVIGFFLKLKPYPMLEEIRSRGKLFQPAFGPVLVVDGDTVRERARARPGIHGRSLRRRDGEGDVAARTTAASARSSSAPTTTRVYEPDKRLLSLVCNRRGRGADHRRHSPGLHAARRDGRAGGARRTGRRRSMSSRASPATCRSRWATSIWACRSPSRPGSFALTDEMLTYYGEPIDGQPETALGRDDGVIPDEAQMYAWIKAAFQHFFNNVQKDPRGAEAGLPRLPPAARLPASRDRAFSASASWTASRWPTRC